MIICDMCEQQQELLEITNVAPLKRGLFFFGASFVTLAKVGQIGSLEQLQLVQLGQADNEYIHRQR